MGHRSQGARSCSVRAPGVECLFSSAAGVFDMPAVEETVPVVREGAAAGLAQATSPALAAGDELEEPAKSRSHGGGASRTTIETVVQAFPVGRAAQQSTKRVSLSSFRNACSRSASGVSVAPP